MAVPKYTEPTAQDALKDPTYTGQAGLYDQQYNLNNQGLNSDLSYTQKSYAQQRQDLINSYQSSLDQINIGLKDAGIQTRSQYAGRNLYDASGAVSGIGQGVGAQNVAPYLNQIKNLQNTQASSLSTLGLNENKAITDIRGQISQAGLTRDQQKYSLLQDVLGNIKTSRKEKYNSKVTDYNAKLKADTDAYNAKLKARQDTYDAINKEQDKGRTYLSSMNAVNDIIRSGRHVIRTSKGYFALSDEEELARAQKEATLAKTISSANKKTSSSGSGSSSSTKTSSDKYSIQTNDAGGLWFIKNGKQIGAFTYAAAKGKSLIDVLGNSRDPGDIALVADIKRYRANGASDQVIYSKLKETKPWLFTE